MQKRTFKALVLGAFSTMFFSFVFMGVKSIVPVSAANEAGTTYYISSSEGDDNNDGTSKNAPWQSFDNINTMILSEGDKILLKSGDVFTQRLSITGNGTEDNYIEIGAYGEGEKPIIRQTNDDDDIAVLLNDFYADANGDAVAIPIQYIKIHDLRIEDTAMGIYVRIYATSNSALTNPEMQSKYVEVSDCEFVNIQNQALHDLNKTVDDAEANYDGFSLTASNAINQVYKQKITELHGRAHGDLPMIKNGKYAATGGGSYEYVFATSVFVGGRKEGVTDATILNTSTAFECLTVKDCVMMEAVSGVMCYFYNFNGTSGFDGYKQAVKNIRIENITATGCAPSIVGLSTVDGGGVLDGNSVKPSPEGWGVIKNVRVIHGALDKENGVPLGTTNVIIEGCKNLLFTECEFNGSLNHNNCDGCGFDFEGGTMNIEVSDCVLSYNEGGAFLMMDNGNGSHKNIFIKNNLMYANLQNAYHQYNNRNNGIDNKYFHVYNKGNENVIISNNAVHMQRYTTMGEGVVFIGPRTAEEAGYTLVDNRLSYYEDGVEYENYTVYCELLAEANCVKLENIDLHASRYGALRLSVRGASFNSGTVVATYFDGAKSDETAFTLTNGYIDLESLEGIQTSRPLKSLEIKADGIRAGAAVTAEFFPVIDVSVEDVSETQIQVTIGGAGAAFARDLQGDDFGLCNLFSRKKIIEAKRVSLDTALLTLDGELTEKEKGYLSLDGVVVVNSSAYAGSLARVMLGIDVNEMTNENLSTYVQSVRLESRPTKTTYQKGEAINLNGTKLVAVNADGTETEVSTDKIIAVGYDKDKTGSQIIGLYYRGKYAYITVNVSGEGAGNNDSGCGSVFGGVGAIFTATVGVGIFLLGKRKRIL